MFTGIVEEVGVVTDVTKIDGGTELSIQSTFGLEVHIDESISVNGVCLTVVSFDEQVFKVQCVEETLRKTNLGRLDVGSKVNLERSLTLAKTIEGHIVQGHVDTTGKIIHIDKEGADLLVWLEVATEYQNYIVGRGSVALDGISLTVARDEEDRFAVAIIPYTWDFTNLREKKVGDLLNIEFDIFGKYIIKYLEKREAAGDSER